MKKNLPILLVILTLFVLQVACSSSSATPEKVGSIENTQISPNEKSNPTAAEKPVRKPTNTTAPQPTATAPTLTTYKTGDIVTISDFVMVILGWEALEPNQFTKPDEGKKFIAVEAIFINNSKETVSISSMLQMTLRDDTGQKYTVDLMANSLAKANPEGELSPGEKKRGQIAFEVPQDVKELKFVFDAEIFDTGKVFIELPAEPGIMQAPTELVGEAPQNIYKIGDTVKIGDINMTVNEVKSAEGNQFTKPKEGHKFLIVDVTFENHGSEAQALSTVLQMTIKDTTGQSYKVDLMAASVAGGSSPDGEIASGEKLRGQVGFEVPEEAQGLIFVFDASLWESGKVFVSLD